MPILSHMNMQLWLFQYVYLDWHKKWSKEVKGHLSNNGKIGRNTEEEKNFQSRLTFYEVGMFIMWSSKFIFHTTVESAEIWILKALCMTMILEITYGN